MPNTRVLGTSSIKAQSDGNIVGNATSLNDNSDVSIVYRNDAGLSSRYKTWVMDTLLTSGAAGIAEVTLARTQIRGRYQVGNQGMSHIRYETGTNQLHAPSWSTSFATKSEQTQATPQNSSAWSESVADNHGYGIASSGGGGDGSTQECSEQWISYDWTPAGGGFALFISNWIGFVPVLRGLEDAIALRTAFAPRHRVFDHELPQLLADVRAYRAPSFWFMGLPSIVRRRGLHWISEDVAKFYRTKKVRDHRWFSPHATSVRPREVAAALAL